MACEFDITWRYSDLLTNFTICISLLMFETIFMYKIMIWLLIALLLVYCIDHVRLLRFTRHGLHATEYLSKILSYWWSVPTGLLGSIGVHWIGEAQGLLGNYEYHFMLLFFLGHCAVYCSILTWLRASVLLPVPKRELYYAEMCELRLRQEIDVSTYFNVNPVHVLRSWLLPDEYEE